MFNKLVIKNSNAPKIRPFFIFMEGFKSYCENTESFTNKIYRNSKLNFLVNFNLILSTLNSSKLSKSLVKDIHLI